MDLDAENIHKISELIKLSNNPILDTSSKLSILNQCIRVLDIHITECMEIQHQITIETKKLYKYPQDRVQNHGNHDNSYKSTRSKVPKKIDVIEEMDS
jgi:hypothetical protein